MYYTQSTAHVCHREFYERISSGARSGSGATALVPIFQGGAPYRQSSFFPNSAACISAWNGRLAKDIAEQQASEASTLDIFKSKLQN